MACCSCKDTDRVAVSCLGRCDIPKHNCLNKEDLCRPIPKRMGWLYTAKDSPEHQLRCGWRPGHISCPVLKKIEQHNCMKCGGCSSCNACQPCSVPCGSPCGGCSYPCAPPPCRPPACRPSPCRPRPCRTPCRNPCQPKPCQPVCRKSCCNTPSCTNVCPSTISCQSAPCNPPLIRIIRHAGQYSIVTKPSNITNHPSGPYPLKYVLNTKDNDPSQDKNAKFSIEAKFNDYCFDYTSSQSSFVLDFSPPDQKCLKSCPKRSTVCLSCQQTAAEPDVK